MRNNYKQAVTILIAVNLLIGIVKLYILTHWQYDLHFEETQYWLWSKYLDFSYYSKPPMVAYLNWISTYTFGDTVFAIKFIPLLLGGLTSILVYTFAYELFQSKKVALLSGLVIHLMPFFFWLSMFHTTDSSLAFFWLLTYYLIWMALKYNDKKYYWILAGIAFGLGILAKYAMLFLIPIIITYLLIYRRDIFKNKFFYLFLFIGLFFLTPILYWNYKDNFVGFSHLQELADGNNNFSLNRLLRYLSEFIGGQLIMLSPFIIIPFLWQSKTLKYYANKKIAFLALPPIFVLVTFLAWSIIKSKVPYINWTIFSFTTVPILFALFYVSHLKKYFISSSVVLILLFLFLFNLHLLDATGLGSYLPPQKDPVKRIAGLKNSFAKIESKINDFPSSERFLFSTSSNLTNMLSFYLREKETIFYINNGERMSQQELWNHLKNYNYHDKYAVAIDYYKPNKNLIGKFEEYLYTDSVDIIHRNIAVEKLYISVFKKYNEALTISSLKAN